VGPGRQDSGRPKPQRRGGRYLTLQGSRDIDQLTFTLRFLQVRHPVLTRRLTSYATKYVSEIRRWLVVEITASLTLSYLPALITRGSVTGCVYHIF
jgi:hypothetical protein